MEDIELTVDLAMRAGDLAELLALQGYDAVHLASAEAAVDADGVLAGADGWLVVAAQTLGLTVARLS